MVRDSKPKEFFYLDHRSVDGNHHIIAKVHVTHGNMHKSIGYLDRLDRQLERFEFKVAAVRIDKGSSTAPIFKGLRDRFFVIPHKRSI